MAIGFFTLLAICIKSKRILAKTKCTKCNTWRLAFSHCWPFVSSPSIFWLLYERITRRTLHDTTVLCLTITLLLKFLTGYVFKPLQCTLILAHIHFQLTLANLSNLDWPVVLMSSITGLLNTPLMIFLLGLHQFESLPNWNFERGRTWVNFAQTLRHLI
jgi:hypothetical protein